MGHIYTELKAIGLKSNHDFEGVVIDTGATYTSLPKELIDEVGALSVPGDKIKLELADGQVIKADSYALTLRIGKRKAPAIVVTFHGATPAIGVQTLEALGLKVNPVTEELEETRAPGISYL